MTIGILQCGELPEPLRARFGSYGGMVRRLFEDRRDIVIHDVAQGDLPASPVACAAYVLTGSSAGVYDDLPWIPPLLEFLRAARGRAKLIGICFGHQAMAQAFGGQVVKSPKGWGIGVQRYAVVGRRAWMDSETTQVAVPASHQDQVVECPTDARVVLASDFTPFAGLDYGDAISFQCHPEFTPEFGRALVDARRELYGPLAAPARASYDQPTDSASVARWIARFLETR